MNKKFLAGIIRVSSAALLVSFASSLGWADDFSFQGSFTSDDNVQLFNFAVGATSTVTLRTWSYAGGVDAAGVTIPRGGFDPELALFDGAGALIDQNDDDGTGTVAADAVTGAYYDTYLQESLAPGNYTVAVMEFDNHAIGPNLSDGFTRQGQGNFTAGWFGCSASQFCDVSGNVAGDARTGNWEFDILGVNSAGTVTSDAPEPASVGLLVAGVGALAIATKKYRAQRQG